MCARRMLAGEPVTIFGDGTKTRDYVYVGDVVEATVRAAAGPSGVVANVAWGREVADLELFREVAAATGYPKGPTHAADRRGDIARICLDPTVVGHGPRRAGGGSRGERPVRGGERGRLLWPGRLRAGGGVPRGRAHGSTLRDVRQHRVPAARYAERCRRGESRRVSRRWRRMARNRRGDCGHPAPGRRCV